MKDKKIVRLDKGGKKREDALLAGLDFYLGNKCPSCQNVLKFTRNAACVTCYTDTGINLNFEKRKKALLDKIKAQAKRKSVPFDLDVSDIIWVNVCPILNIELDYFAKGKKANTVSFDRKNPDKGYVAGDVFILSNKANSCKSDLNVEQIERLLNYVRS